MGKTSFSSEGKQAFRALLLELAKRDSLKTYGTLWGTGIDSRLFASEGFDVTAAEVERAKHEEMRADAEAHGYEAFCGNAKRLDQRFDMFHADFCGTAGPSDMHRTVGRLAGLVDMYLAVTVTASHQLNPWLQRDFSLATFPSWFADAAPGLAVAYLSQYEGDGHTMWTAIMRVGHVRLPNPATVRYAFNKRGYWASEPLYSTGALEHTTPPVSDHVRRYHKMYKREQRNTPAIIVQNCLWCGASFRYMTRPGGPAQFCKDDCRRLYSNERAKLRLRRRRASIKAARTPKVIDCTSCCRTFTHPAGKSGPPPKRCPRCRHRAKTEYVVAP